MESIDLDVTLAFHNLTFYAGLWSNYEERFREVPIVFDTGATITAISPVIAVALGYQPDYDNVVEINSATQAGVNAIPVIIPNLKLKEVALGPVYAYIINFPPEGNTFALLGLNVIQHFLTTIKFNRPKAEIKLEPMFDIDNVESLDTYLSHSSRFGVWSAQK